MADQEPLDSSAPSVTPDAPVISSPGESSTPSPSVTPGESPAPSPSAPPSGDTRADLLAAVQQAVPELRTSRDDDGEGGASPAPSETPDPNAPPQPVSPDQLPDEPTAEELAGISPKTRARMQRLLDDRRKLRDSEQKLKADVERFTAQAPLTEAASSVQKYLIDNDIGQQDFALTLELAAAMRQGNFKAFYEGVRPYVQLAEEYLGIRLPADLQQAVQQGQMTSQAAALFSKERMDRALAQSRGMRSQQLFEERQQQSLQGQQEQAQAQLVQNVQDKVNAWEQAVARTDPDYQRLKPLLHQLMWSVVREQGGTVQSPDQAVAIAKEAYARTKAQASALSPMQRRPTSRVPSSTGRTNGAAPEPTSLREVVQRALESARANT